MENNQQREAVARLVGVCEAIVENGILPMEVEMKLRTYANDACAAFGMLCVVERGTGALVYDATNERWINHA